MTPFHLFNKHILITGASSGIGRAVAIASTEMGAQVTLTARREEELKKLLQTLPSTQQHNYIPCDLTNKKSLEELVNKLSPIDGLLCNAGKTDFRTPRFLRSDQTEELFQLNLYSQIDLIHLLLKQRKIKPKASIVFTSSIAGVFHHHESLSSYAMSKAAVDVYAKSLALELARKNIRVNCVNPGKIAGDFDKIKTTFRIDEQDPELNKYPLKRYGTPEDVAWGIVYLLSEASSWVTGSNLKIDGGRTLI